MPIRVVDPKVTKEVDVSGSKVVIKSLNVSQKQKIAFAINDSGLINTPIDKFAYLIAEGIVSIDSQTDGITETLLNLESLEDFWKIVGSVLSFSTLNEDEEKNSSSSSDAEKTNSAGSSVGMIAEKGGAPVSTITKMKQ